jgi:anaerobic selenocysteine-containing dehydrogenase
VLAPADAGRLGIEEGGGVRLGRGDGAATVAARIDPALPAGAVGLVDGLTGRFFAVPGERVEVAADPDFAPPGGRVFARG